MKAIRGKRLTSREAARVLGVSEASVKRWADGGLLPVERTAGGHRRVRPEDLAAARRAVLSEEEAGRREERSAARLRASSTARAKELSPGNEAALVEETFKALLDGRDEELSALLVSLHLDGHTVTGMADLFLCAAMRRVGDLWHRGELTVAEEHLATRTAIRALQNLEAVVEGEEKRLLALCCSVENDFHWLPVRLAALTLAAGGCEVLDLGTSTPFSALGEALERFRPRVVCISSTLLCGLDRAAREYAGFHRRALRRGSKVVLGGAGFADAAVRGRFPADLYAESFRQLEEFMETLYASEA